MSVQFGRWNLDAKPVDPSYLVKVGRVIAPYGPDDSNSYTDSNISILYRAFHTNKESRREKQPHVTESGATLTWDGRLDNRSELILQFGNILTNNSPDISIVAAAYEKWGACSFAKLLGDWAISIWDPRTRSLILAKDLIGTRHLYYSIEKDHVTWSTILDPLVLFADRRFDLNEEYIAGWFSFFPDARLTPFVGIHSVPPSSWVAIRNGRQSISKHWDFDPTKSIRYDADAGYEEHFLGVFGEAVRRRLRSDSPVLAELSGGMDSSSIVSMADTIIARRTADTPRLDTISYFNDSEPHWNERPYFTKVEEKRGRLGTHINLGLNESLKLGLENRPFAGTPGSGSASNSETHRQFAACMTQNGNRIVLSGIGGDEVLGGVPTPLPELADLLATGQFQMLAYRLKVWGLNARKPWFHLLFEAATGFLPPAFVSVPKHTKPAAWLNPTFVKRNRFALRGYETRLKLVGPPPTFQENVSTLQVLQRQLACSKLSSRLLYEKRYPYLDRDLLEFVFSIPREQLLRPGQRRSLMRRALVGIVPDELLNRRRKAFVTRSSLEAIAANWSYFTELTHHMLITSLGIVDEKKFLAALQEAREGKEVPTVPIMRALNVEHWLKNLQHQGLSTGFATRVV
jgi:asparagine synthase (glutamine-hydrolysing)